VTSVHYAVFIESLNHLAGIARIANRQNRQNRQSPESAIARHRQSLVI